MLPITSGLQAIASDVFGRIDPVGAAPSLGARTPGARELVVHPHVPLAARAATNHRLTLQVRARTRTDRIHRRTLWWTWSREAGKVASAERSRVCSMWALHNSTPFVADRFFTRDKHGAEVWVVVVKGSFEVRPDGSLISARQQEPVHHSPQFIGDPARSSLYRDTDLLPPRPFTDVIVLGHAYAPAGHPCAQVDVGVRVGSLDKRLRVWGDRVWRRGLTGLTLSEPELFERIPLVYERAFGGFDPDGATDAHEPQNPAGIGFAASPVRLLGTPAPNIEDPAHPIRDPRDRPPPVGFGPIPSHWQPRARRAGTYDTQWEQDRMPLVPVDFEDRHYQCAPDDQQIEGGIQGGEAVELHNLTPDGIWRFTLPRIPLIFSTRISGQAQRHNASIQTVIIEPDRGRVVLVWASAVPCHQTLYTLEGTWVRQEGALGYSHASAQPARLVTLRTPGARKRS